MISKRFFTYAMHIFCEEIRIPTSLVVEPPWDKTYTQVKDFCNQVGISFRLI